ncbi:MAG: hypothetical protein H4O13_16765 [Xanthomonadales bacterium]|nr:hypothetical protein [Xanthomonadales bacterium]
MLEQHGESGVGDGKACERYRALSGAASWKGPDQRGSGKEVSAIGGDL